MLLSLSLSIVFSSFLCVSAIGRTQSVAVKGKLLCDSTPLSGVKVKLYDVDFGPIDDLLDQSKSGADGTFELKGHTEEITNIDPRLNIYHDCNDGIKPCQRKVVINIPSSYISSGPNPRKVYDAGTLQLSGKYPGESRDCLN